MRAVRSLAELPAPPDVVVIATPPDTVPGIVAQAAELGNLRRHHRHGRPRSWPGLALRLTRPPSAARARRPARQRSATNCLFGGVIVPAARLNASFAGGACRAPGRPRADLAVRWHGRRDGRMGGAAVDRLLGDRLDRRPDRRRHRRPGRLFRARSSHARDPALCRGAARCAQVHVGRAGSRAHKARGGDQGGAPCRGRRRRRQPTRARSRARTRVYDAAWPQRRAGLLRDVRPRRVLRRRRDARPRARGAPASGSPSSPMAAASVCWRSIG